MEDADHNNLYHELDWSHLEGGDQMLRNSMAYSALLKKGIRITHIGEGRDPGGLSRQHFSGILEVQKLCDGDLLGATVRSTTLSFLPGELRPGGLDLHVDIQPAAGSITLLIQTILPLLLFQPLPPVPSSSWSSSWFKPSTVTILGGTNVPDAPQIDFFIHVFLPVAKRMFGEERVRAIVLKRGYYPRGQGMVRLEVTPLEPGESLRALDLTEQGSLTRIGGYIFVGGTLPSHIAWDMHRQAVQDLRGEEKVGRDRFPELEQDLGVAIEREVKGRGSGLVLWGETDTGCVLSGSAVRNSNQQARSVASAATWMLRDNLSSKACVDEFLQDQLIIFMALAKGRSRILTGPLTLHSKTCMWVATELTGVIFDVTELDDGNHLLIECDGIGFTSPPQANRANAGPSFIRNEWVVV